MDREVQKLREKFHGTDEEFEAGRRAALKRAEELKQKLREDEQKEIESLKNDLNSENPVMDHKKHRLEAAERSGFGKTPEIRGRYR